MANESSLKSKSMKVPVRVPEGSPTTTLELTQAARLISPVVILLEEFHFAHRAERSHVGRADFERVPCFHNHFHDGVDTSEEDDGVTGETVEDSGVADLVVVRRLLRPREMINQFSTHVVESREGGSGIVDVMLFLPDQSKELSHAIRHALD